jgi:hypothetical protein
MVRLQSRCLVKRLLATGFTGTLDGVLGGGTPAAVNGTTLTASGDLTFTGSNPKISGGESPDGFLRTSAGNTRSVLSGAAVSDTLPRVTRHATDPASDIVWFFNSGTPAAPAYDYSANTPPSGHLLPNKWPSPPQAPSQQGLLMLRR